MCLITPYLDLLGGLRSAVRCQATILECHMYDVLLTCTDVSCPKYNLCCRQSG